MNAIVYIGLKSTVKCISYTKGFSTSVQRLTDLQWISPKKGGGTYVMSKSCGLYLYLKKGCYKVFLIKKNPDGVTLIPHYPIHYIPASVQRQVLQVRKRTWAVARNFGPSWITVLLIMKIYEFIYFIYEYIYYIYYIYDIKIHEYNIF